MDVENISAERYFDFENNVYVNHVKADFKLREAMNGNVMLNRITNVDHLSSSMNFNDGFITSGDSMNPQPEIIVNDRFDRNKLKSIILIDKSFLDKSEGFDTNGVYWYVNDNGFWQREGISPTPVANNPLERHSSEFKERVILEEQKASELLSSYYGMSEEKSFSEIDNIFAYELPEDYDRLEVLPLSEEESKALMYVQEKWPDLYERYVDIHRINPLE